ncbi:family 78 glycoside hydrolase catalytic domain [Novosphingobium colocasiae]|uniref:family 78 glycoside hydrolase catalytic domain n=1 Tax=Novosphingobium colocasiae TaxID=1256513 RepID=UPI0016729E92|nr:family 78 glycoside hydrolase catalytic domain [Novosphingobium colocasiae]
MLQALLFAFPAAAGDENQTYGLSAPRLSTAQTAVGELLDDPAARAVIARHAPDLLPNPEFSRRRSSSLADLQSNFPAVLTPAVLAAIDADLGALPPSPATLASLRTARAEVTASKLDPTNPWITHPAAYNADFQQQPLALQFRRSFILERRPARLLVHVSADQRFVLYANGRRIAAGPARGDLQHYRYERIDLAPYLKSGRNTLAAQVWSDGKLAPAAMVSAGHTGFMLKSDALRYRTVGTSASWQVRVDPSRVPSSGRRQLIQSLGPVYYVAGPPETHDAARQLVGWQGAGVGRDWISAVPAVSAGQQRRVLVPDLLPQMRLGPAMSGKIVRISPANALQSGRVTVAPGQHASILIDLGRVQAGYPLLVTSGGKGSNVSLTYTEALYDPADRGPSQTAVKFADRGRIDNGLALGLTDRFLLDGRSSARFEPLWWRAGRYIEVRVEAGKTAVNIDRVAMRETGYPFSQRGRFASDDPQLNRIWQIGWNTALVDAHETYMDTAYWEQLQYIGDTRIQAMLSYDVAGDPRLAVQALDAFEASRRIDGLPQSAWPMSGVNSIPPFALLWIGMLHDYWMRQPDTAVLKRNLAGMRSVLDWYRPYVRDDGMVRATPGWLFIDWRDGLDGGRDRTGASPDSCIIALLRIGALREAADIEGAVGSRERSTANLAEAAKAAQGVQARCWDQSRQLYADDPDHRSFSQHANVLAVLYDVAPKDRQQDIMARIMAPGKGIDAPAGITATTFYFSFYLARALDHAGLAGGYLDLLETWRGLLGQHFTTWPERPDPSRSDSHAWSAHPTSGLLTYVAGIQPATAGFARVRISPHLGRLNSLDAAMAHPRGNVQVAYRRLPAGLVANIRLPAGLSGTFVWQARKWPLRPGPNRIVVPSH